MRRIPTRDCTGESLKVGDVVRIIRMQDLAGMSERALNESEPVFAYLVGKYRRIEEIDDYGRLEFILHIRHGKLSGKHFVYVDPQNVRKRRSRLDKERSVTITQFPIGSRVIKNKRTWVPNDFDSWGRGEGVGTVVEPPFRLEDKDVDVRWPAGRCFEEVSGLLPAPHDERLVVRRKNGPRSRLKGQKPGNAQ